MLGVHIDQKLNFKLHIDKICQPVSPYRIKSLKIYDSNIWNSLLFNIKSSENFEMFWNIINNLKSANCDYTICAK